MPYPELSLEEAFQGLISRTRSLRNTVEGRIPEIRETLDPSTKLPVNYPSRASMALLIFGQVRKKLQEVNEFVPIVEDAIRRSGK
jgi:hypothetical protein